VTDTGELETPCPPYAGITYVVPCGGQKLDRPAPARDLYVGQMFRHTLENAERSARLDTEQLGVPARVLILSGKYGLVELDQVLEPYEQRMDRPGSVTAAVLTEQATALGIDWGSQVYGLLPRPYLRRLDEALRTLDVFVQDVYEACGGIGEQRRVNAHVGAPPRSSGDPVDEPGLQVWIGGDVQAFWWGERLLVSYDRLRDSKVLPVASAPWVLDSGGYAELVKHSGWTVSAEQYAADIRRYATEIGQLRWAAAQDWPASQRVLEATGLTELEHQARTTASGVELRAADTGGVHVLLVVTATTPAGYLRHMAMYRKAGIDLHAEPLVGVGALLGRPVREQAQIVRLLHAAGLTRLHLFGGKNQLLDEVGHLVVSVDSMGWSDDARRAEDLCPHGLVRWERNCPEAARAWAVRQRERAARASELGVQADLWGPVLVDLAC
jgi:hypothetical protein